MRFQAENERGNGNGNGNEGRTIGDHRNRAVHDPCTLINERDDDVKLLDFCSFI